MKNEVKVERNWGWPHYHTFSYEGGGITINITVSAGPLFAKRTRLVERFCEDIMTIEEKQ